MLRPISCKKFEKVVSLVYFKEGLLKFVVDGFQSKP
jgi:hypothetical protein